MTTITREQAQKIIEAADEVITALAGTNEDVHPESDNMLRLWDDLNDRYAPPEVVRELARIALASLDADSNSHPAHGPLSNYRLHRIREILSKAAAQSDGGNIGYAMSDAVKAIDELLEVRKVEPVGEVIEQPASMLMDGCVSNEKATYRNIKGIHKMKRMPLGTKFYTAPPAPVPMRDHQIRKLVNELRDIAVEYHGTQQLREHIARKVRAATLNHSGDVTEMGEAIKQQSTMQPSNGAMSGDAVKQSSSNAHGGKS